MKKILALALALLMVLGTFAACVKPDPQPEESKPEETIAKEAPMLAELVAAGTLPSLENRLPVAGDVYVETEYSPAETPTYGGTIRTYENGIWYCGPITEEPLFRLLDDGTVEANVAKSYDLSADGLTYTIHLREGMKWSDGEPFTAEDCVYYYNYVLVTKVGEDGKVTSNTTKTYNWYMSVDPADGKTKPAQVRLVDATTFTITLYSPKPTMLQAIAIDNKWMFCPKHWYKDVMAVDMETPHWSGETDLTKIGGNGLVTVTEDQAIANAAAKNERFTFADYHSLCDQIGYRYWQYADRPTIRPWVLVSEKTDNTQKWVRNAYYWKVDKDGRQLPYIDNFEFVKMDAGLWAQELIAGNIDLTAFGSSDFPTYKSAEATGNFKVGVNIAPNWTVFSLELNQTYKDPQYAQLFANIDFRHALSIAANREEINEIVYNGMAQPSQAAAPKGSGEYIDGATEKWTEYDPEAANKLLDGIAEISTERNADGYRTFVGGANAGKAVTLEIEGDAQNASGSQAIALLAKYFQAVGIQVVEVSNTDNNARNEKLYIGDVAMASAGQSSSVFSAMLRPDYLAANRNNVCWLGLYGMEHKNCITPEPGTPIAEIVDATKAMVAAATLEELQAATQRILQSHYENTWIIGYIADAQTFSAVTNRVHNYRDGFVYCDELRFFGNTRPFTWFVQD